MIRTHISVSEKIDTIIKDYCIKYNLKYSQAVAKLIELGSSNIEVNKAININNNMMDKMYSKLSYTTSLLEQFYSDMELDELTNPNNNKALEKFRNKRARFKYDD